MTPDETLKNTFLAKITEVLASGNFIEPEQEIDPDGTVIGEMTPLEKAVYTVIRTVIQGAEQILPPCDCGVACVNACTCQPPISPDLEQDLITANIVLDALQQTLSALVQERLRYANEEIDGFFCCKGFKIVALPPQPEMLFLPGGFGSPDGTPTKIGSA
ncbi:MAG: hypothetical protein AAB568_03410 [Patescibacteria group bacterium]